MQPKNLVHSLEAWAKAAQACTLNAPFSHSRLKEAKTTRLHKQEAIQVSMLAWNSYSSQKVP